MNCIVNVSQNWGIGNSNQLLFSICADLKRFRQLTTGKVVILGRKTLQTFPGGRPLKNRTNLILSATAGFQVEGATVYRSASQLLQALREYPQEQLCVIGGASVYELLLPYCHTAQITKTLQQVQADRFFPNLDALEHWTLTAASDVMEEDGVRFQYLDYRNQAPLPLSAVCTHRI